MPTVHLQFITMHFHELRKVKSKGHLYVAKKVETLAVNVN